MMYQVVIDIPQGLQEGFVQENLSLRDFFQQYLLLRQQEKDYSLFTDDLLNPVSFEGSADECIADLRSLIK